MTETADSVLDASALLAYLHQEPGFGVVESAVADGAFISVVNYCEVLARLADSGIDASAADRHLRERGIVGGLIHIVAMTVEDALLAADLRATTRALGLSLGDRVCLATGLRLGLPVVTADRAWADLMLGVEVRVIRP